MSKSLIITEEEHYLLKNLSAKSRKKINELVKEAIFDLVKKYEDQENE